MNRTLHNIVSLATGQFDSRSIDRSSFRSVFSAGAPRSDAATYIIFGDLHGSIRGAQTLSVRVQEVFRTRATAIFQVGDFGYWPAGAVSQQEDEFYKESDALDFATFIARATEDFSIGEGSFETLSAPFYFIRGNHEDLAQLQKVELAAPSPVAHGFWFIPDGYSGEIAGLRVFGVGGILRDTERGRGKRNKRQRKAAIQALATDPRFSDATLLTLPKQPINMLLTHSGPASREKRHGSTRLDRTLATGSVPLHFYGHHHRFSLLPKGDGIVSVGLRNLAANKNGLLGGCVAVLQWSDDRNFEVHVHDPPSSS